MESTYKLFKEKKIRITSQRVAVYEVLCYLNKHLTAEEIYEKIKAKNPSISFATIYSILDLFRQKGLVREIRIQFDKSYFETRMDMHHHFLCRACQETFDIDMPLCEHLKSGDVDGASIEEFQGYFYGVCRHCKE